LVVDDSTLDKPYAKQIDLVQRHWSGKHQAVVEGINLITLLWTEGDRHVPVDYRLYDKLGDELTKNDHFQALPTNAAWVPECVVFDSWYGSLVNLKLIDGWGWVWLTRLKANRLVNPDRRGLRAVARVETDANGTLVHLKGYGLIRLFKIVAPDGDMEWWASNDLQMSALTRVRFAGYAWTIEHYHRGIKQFCGVERAQVRAARAQRHHIGLCLRAFLRFERHCYHAGVSWFEAKTAIIRPAVRAYLADPLYNIITGNCVTPKLIKKVKCSRAWSKLASTYVVPIRPSAEVIPFP
jgi:putative transposase